MKGMIEKSGKSSRELRKVLACLTNRNGQSDKVIRFLINTCSEGSTWTSRYLYADLSYVSA